MNNDVTSFGSDGKEPKVVPSIILQDRHQKGVIRPDPIQEPVDNDAQQAVVEDQKDQLPTPTGYRILVLPYTAPKTSKGGIHLTAATLRTEDLATTVGLIVCLGPDAYKDTGKFPAGAWCKEGDYVLLNRYSGAKISMATEDGDDLPLRLINDDEVLAVITNPKDYVGVN